MKYELLARLKPAGQEHLVARWDELDDAAQRRLSEQIRGVDLELVARVFHQEEQSARAWEELSFRAEPPTAFRLLEKASAFPSAEARRRGEAALAAGRVAVVLVAGGNGSRLGYHHPKGLFPLGPVSGRSLLQMHIDQIRALSRRYGRRVPLCLMTSPATHEETEAFLDKNNLFGLRDDELLLFTQGTLPAVDCRTGRILLAGRDRLALGPDGHGGMLPALAGGGLLEELRRRGIEQLFYLQVDNPLVRIGDPRFLGLHLLTGSEMSTQVVAKTDPGERLGNVVRLDDRTAIIEYIHLSPEAAAQRNADGSLYLWAGNLAVHAFDLAFLERMAGRERELPIHRALKRIPCLDDEGRVVLPVRENAFKFERFIFDLLPWARETMVMEVDRRDSFAPVKNADEAGRDTPRTSRAAMVDLFTRWLQDAGASVADGVPVEIHPLFALDAAELAAKIEPGLHVGQPRFFADEGPASAEWFRPGIVAPATDE
jgi:UDP-N-acetylglucosamine/UDP-N-acetylgalactosamine diphosphorylase